MKKLISKARKQTLTDQQQLILSLLHQIILWRENFRNPKVSYLPSNFLFP